jgi:hypothetical protein
LISNFVKKAGLSGPAFLLPSPVDEQQDDDDQPDRNAEKPETDST